MENNLLDTNQITVIDENGNEVLMEILFTFSSDETGKSYVLYFDPEAETTEVFASSYQENGSLQPIETQEEWTLVEEVFASFNENGQAGGCGCQEDGEGCCGNGGTHEGACGCK